MKRQHPPSVIDFAELRQISIDLSVAAAAMSEVVQLMAKHGLTELNTYNVKAMRLAQKNASNSAPEVEKAVKKAIQSIAIDAEAQKVASEAIRIRDELEVQLTADKKRKGKK
jgi:hypothetical protein